MPSLSSTIVVTINYRLDAFGFLFHDSMRKRDPANGSAGNYGVSSSRASLNVEKDTGLTLLFTLTRSKTNDSRSRGSTTTLKTFTATRARS